MINKCESQILHKYLREWWSHFSARYDWFKPRYTYVSALEPGGGILPCLVFGDAYMNHSVIWEKESG